MIPEFADLFRAILFRAILSAALAAGAAALLLGIVVALVVWTVNKWHDTHETINRTEIVKYDEAA